MQIQSHLDFDCGVFLSVFMQYATLVPVSCVRVRRGNGNGDESIIAIYSLPGF
jgi:hypothetical protein